MPASLRNIEAEMYKPEKKTANVVSVPWLVDLREGKPSERLEPLVTTASAVL